MYVLQHPEHLARDSDYSPNTIVESFKKKHICQSSFRRHMHLNRRWTRKMKKAKRLGYQKPSSALKLKLPSRVDYTKAQVKRMRAVMLAWKLAKLHKFECAPSVP